MTRAACGQFSRTTQRGGCSCLEYLARVRRGNRADSGGASGGGGRGDGGRGGDRRTEDWHDGVERRFIFTHDDDLLSGTAADRASDGLHLLQRSYPGKYLGPAKKVLGLQVPTVVK